MTWYRVGPAGIPGSLKTDMDAVLNKKFGTSTTYAPNTWPDNVNLLGPLPEKTASGSIANITDGADAVPLKNWLVTLPASLDGYTEVNGAKTGKNLFDKDNANEIDGYFTTTGFSTLNSNAKTIYIPIVGGVTYTVSKTAGQRFQIATAEAIPSNGELFTARQANNTATSLTITASANDKYLWAWVFLEGTDTITLSEMLASVQIEVGSTPTQYTAYEAPTQYTASLGRTIYGGTADIVTGEGEDENGNAFTFTPIQADTELGVNNFWADEGDSDVTYRADISLALQAINGGRGLMGMMMQRPEEEQLTEEDPEEVPEEEAETNER